jgi:hypothetical protein
MRYRHLPSLLACVCLGTSAGRSDEISIRDLTKMQVYPPRVHLDGLRGEQRLGVLGRFTDGSARDFSRDATYTAENPKVADVDRSGIVRGITDGETVVTVRVAGKTASIPVCVTGTGRDDLVRFTEEVIPVLTRAGCNQGACHGAQHGKGGFKLSLRSFDPAIDYSQIVQSAEGRRVVLSDPERSILLLKPALVMEHGGGERIKQKGREYNLLKRWLEDGAPGPTAKDAEVKRLEVWPQHRRLVPGEKQQVLVTAFWSDGRTQDATTLAQFDALNDAVAVVTPDGIITAKGPGETHIMIRFGGQVAVVRVTLPYARTPSYPDLPHYNYIDEKLIAQWHNLGLTPSPLCGDEEFFRRIHLDTIGTVPAPEDVRAFLKDPDPQKRRKAIDQVLGRPEYVDFWALKWGDLLRINRDFLNERGMWSFHNWVRGCVRANRPVDEMVRDIITAEGSTFTEGPANYYMVARTPADWAETTAQVFLGVRMQCAKCHHHPFEKWSQDDYYGVAAFFVRLGTKGSQEFGIFGGERVVYLKDTGEQNHPRKGEVVPPHPLDGPTMSDPFDRRVRLAEWLTDKANPYFARNLVNRFWGYYMGRGLVEPLDDLRATNPASNPELLDALARDFIAHKYDLKHLLRTIMNSRAYQLSSRVVPGNKADSLNVHFARFTVRRLTAEQLADAVDFATGTREKYVGLPLGTRAIQLPDPRVRSFFLDIFGRPSRQITCECERTVQPNIAQALHLLNGDFLSKKIADPKGRVAKLFLSKRNVAEMVDELYLVALGRLPQEDERARALESIAQGPTPREGVEDFLWALLNTREFMFNH